MENELNVEAAVDSIASDIGLGNEEETGATNAEAADTNDAAGIDNAAGDQAEGATGDQRENAEQQEQQTQVRQAPKAWAKEKHEIWSKLDPSAQEYIELREKQMLEGLSQYGEAAKNGKEWQEAVKDYMPLIQAQGITAPAAVKYLFEAHRSLSSGSPEDKAAYLVRVAKSYGIDMAKAAAAAGAANDEPASVRELRERTERLERERQEELRARSEENRKSVQKTVAAFADAKDEKGNLKHPYFDECAEDIVALINAGHTLETAYEKAIYANPVTRAKELARLRTEEEASLRAKAKQEAEKARSASRTNVSSRDTGRAPTASKAKRWEDTLDETMKEIKARTH